MFVAQVGNRPQFSVGPNAPDLHDPESAQRSERRSPPRPARRMIRRFAPLVIAWIAIGAQPLLADDELVKQLLTDGWGNTKAAKAAAAPLIRQAEEGNPSPDITYAVGLTLISQKDYHRAIEWMNLSNLGESSNLDARRAEIWLLVRTRQHNRALSELSVFLDQISADKELDADRRELLVRFAGRIMGFYAGPAADSVTPSTLDRYSREILTKLAADDVASFDEARDSMLEQYRSAVEEKSDADENAENDAVVIHENLIADLKQRQADLAAELAGLQPQLNQIRDQARTELESIRGKEEPISRELSRLESRVISLDSELTLIINDINQLEFRASRERDPYYRNLYLRDADRLRLTANRIDADLINAQRQHGLLVSKRRQVQLEFQRADAHYQAQIEKVQEAMIQNHRAQRRAALELERALKGPDVDQRRSRSIEAQFNAITTYEEFPLEEERQSILDRLAKE